MKLLVDKDIEGLIVNNVLQRSNNREPLKIPECNNGNFCVDYCILFDIISNMVYFVVHFGSLLSFQN